MAASDMIPKDASILEQNPISKDIDIFHAMTSSLVSAVKCRAMREVDRSAHMYGTMS